MVRPTLAWMVVTGFALLAGGAARAADLEEEAGDNPAAARLALLAEDPGNMPAPTPAAPPAAPAPAPEAPPPAMPAPGVAPGAAGAGAVAGTLEEGPPRPADLSYGAGARLRWVSLPGWMLNLFTKKNVPLSAWASAIEFFRRKGDFDFIVSIGYQNMSPPDGNWLGKGRDAAVDTDLVQFRSLAFWGLDASFIWHTTFNDWVGMHYGAGIGLGIVTGRLLRTSNTGCTDANAGNVTQCHPLNVDCSSGVCREADLQRLGPGVDSSVEPHRFADTNIPGAVPIVNLLVGVDFRLPNVRGWEAKLEGGFYDAFFLGGGVGYTF